LKIIAYRLDMNTTEKNIILFLCAIISLLLNEVALGWDNISGGNHSNANWTPSDGDSIAGVHTGIDTLRITGLSPIKHFDGFDFGFLEIEANVVIVEGTLDASGAGYRGGEGGPSFGRGNAKGGIAGEPGEGPAGGCAGLNGNEGGRNTSWPGGRYAGGGGAGGGRGGGYGGVSCVGGLGGEGQGVWRVVIHTDGADGGDGGVGGSGAGSCPDGTTFLYGTAHGSDIDMGSGGGGAGSGGNNGNGIDHIPGRGEDGHRGGNGGGIIKITADSLYISGAIIANGESGGDGGKGGDSRDCSEGEGPGGGGAGAGGGSGGGILLFAPKMITAESATIASTGGNGGRGGNLGAGMTGSFCPVEAYGGMGGGGGAGGGGGRIKLSYNSAMSVILGNISALGGNGGIGGNGNGVSSSHPGNTGCNGMAGTVSQRQIGSVVIATNLPSEIPDSIFVNSILTPAPFQVFLSSGDSIHIASAYPQNPYFIEGTKYIFTFEGWDCGGDSAQWVPITSDTVFTALFSVQYEYLCSLIKLPATNIAGTLYVDSEIYTGTASLEQSFWWASGSVHEIGVSAVDSIDTTRKWRFCNWSDGGAREHTTSPITNPTNFTADYHSQFPVTVSKYPPENTFGFLSFDLDTFWGIESVFQQFWCDSNSFHALLASYSDTIDPFNRFELNHFSDGFDTSHITDTIRGPIDFVVYYDRQYKCEIRKSPATNTYGYLILDMDTIVGLESARARVWWNHGTTHDIFASNPDIVDSFERFSWDSWSDGSSIAHTTAPIEAPCTLTAFYKREMKVTITKDPATNNCGWMALDGDTVFGIESVFQERWWEYGSLHNVSVSVSSYCSDSIYSFDSWSFGGVSPNFIANILRDTTFVAGYTGSAPLLEILVSDPVWDIGEIYAGDIRDMIDSEEIEITNLSDVMISLGLSIIDTSDWISGHYPDANKFAILGRFQETVPIGYNLSSDVILFGPHRVASNWRYGPGGYGLGFSPPESSKLWLQFRSPLPASSTNYGFNLLKLNITAIPYME